MAHRDRAGEPPEGLGMGERKRTEPARTEWFVFFNEFGP